MKAYQLKIAIKNSRPPIWRRCVVPAGITFSQLGVILNNVMGWTGYHLSAFEFYHRKLRLEELEDDFDTWWEYDLAESSENVIDPYMESEDWFTYLYDFGDHWSHRVTIEEVITDCEYKYPIVLSFKGNCPPEDCGGIQGYYRLIDEAGMETDEGDEIMSLQTEQQPVEDEYNLAEINEMFVANFTIQYEANPDTKRKDELYDELVMSGGNNLKIVKNGKKINTKSNIISSKRHRLNDNVLKIAEYFNKGGSTERGSYSRSNYAKFGLDDSVKKEKELTLAETYNEYTKQDIMEIAKFHSIKYSSSYNKADLIKNTILTILDKRVFTSYFACFQDSEMDTFIRVMEKKVHYKQCAKEIGKPYRAGYCTVSAEEYVEVPADVKTLFREINTKNFQRIRKRRRAVLDCFVAADYLYGYASLGVISNMLRVYTGSEYSIEDILREVEAVPHCLRDFEILEEQYIAVDLLVNKQLDKLRTIQGNKEYYMPTPKEIVELAVEGYIPSEQTLGKFQHYLVKKMHSPLEDAAAASRGIQRSIMMGGDMQKILDILESYKIRVQDEKQLGELVPVISELWNNTRMITNRGFAPNELLREDVKSLKPFYPVKPLPNHRVIDLQQARKNKVYANDKCPCGSGKKYKHCCGRNV